MERNLIVVQNVFEDLRDTEQSIKSIRYAAHRWKSNFYEITSFQFPNSPSNIFWDRLWACQNFLEYDKVLILDPDIVINSKCPNIFEELTSEFDLAVVLDGNPGRFENDPIKNGVVRYISELHESVEIFQKNIPNFDKTRYWENYFNNGVFLYNPKKIYKTMEYIKELLFNNNKIHKFVDYSICGDTFPCQNLFNAVISSSNLKVKNLDNKWNWLMPDVDLEYNHNFFLSEQMIPWIYHFTGTPHSKNFLKTYTKWQTESIK